jgi:hypothetical protein
MCKHNIKHQNVTRIARCASCGGKNLPATVKSIEFNSCEHCYEIKLSYDALANNNLTVEEYNMLTGVGERA